MRAHDLTSSQERRAAKTSGSGLASLGEIVEHITLLLSQCDHNGQDALDKLTAVFTLRTETASAPNHASAQGPLNGVVGWFHTFTLHKSPQRLLDFENIVASSAGNHLFDKGTDAQQGADLLADWQHDGLELRLGQRAIAHTLPPMKHLFDLCKQQSANRFGLSASFDECLEVADEMRPANLPFGRIQPVIGTVAIRADNSRIILAQQPSRSDRTPGREHSKHSHSRGRAYLQPAILSQLLPTGFVQVHHRLLLNVLLCGLDRAHPAKN